MTTTRSDRVTTPFIAVVPAGTSASGIAPRLRAAGATDLLSWAELATSRALGDTLAVLVDLPAADSGADQLDAEVSLALVALARALASATPGHEVVIATVRPVTDTLKLVDADGVLIGTAARDQHRFVGSPIATRLRLLRDLARDVASDRARDPSSAAGPAVVDVLAALDARGAVVLAGC